MVGNFCSILLSSLLLVISVPGWSIEKRAIVLTEVAPLKSALGQVSLRSEYLGANRLGYGIGYEDLTHVGVRDDVMDHNRRLFAEILWYPVLEGLWDGLFVGGGGLYEQARIGRQVPRRYSSEVRPYADEQFDRWVNYDEYAAFLASFGYRYFWSKYLTMSARLSVDQLLYQKTRTADKEIFSYERETGAERRQPVRQHLQLLVGLAL